MITPSKYRRKVKEIAYRVLTPALADQLRNIVNKKDIFFYDRNLAKKVEEFVEQRKKHGIPVKNDIELLKYLHTLFPTINLASNYNIQNLKNSARNRYRYLASKGIDIKQKDVADFGAGHGENLMVADEFDLKSAIGLDFSDDRFQQHRDKISDKALQRIEYKTLDLVKDDIGDNSADIVLSFSAFEHFENPAYVLDKCYRLLRKGGYLYAEFAAFNAPYAIHRKIFSGVPHIQDIFDNAVAYEFFYDFLKINPGVNRYTNEKITDENPYPEVNRWQITDYENVFLDSTKWDVRNYTKLYNYKYNWYINIFAEYFKGKRKDDLYVDGLKFLIRKK
ncbi:class I SAM-dependent methyltransferase [Candidatus Pseudothioglobus singularis]|nr:class I SAM-dependent methyltransferase [Candidatus Pseudothioglobus singularis]